MNDIKPSKTINFIFGPNGVGKGTLAEKLCNEYGLVTVSMGDTIRDYANKKEHHDVKELIDNGEFVGDDIIKLALLEKFDSIKSDPRSIIMDGVPRRASQIPFFPEICEKFGFSIGWVIVLSAPVEIIEERLEERVVAPNGKVYHLRYNPPPKEYTADQLTTRLDDRPEIVKKRYEFYMIHTLECLGNSLFADAPTGNIDATQSIDKVFQDACWFIEDLAES